MYQQNPRAMFCCKNLPPEDCPELTDAERSIGIIHACTKLIYNCRKNHEIYFMQFLLAFIFLFYLVSNGTKIIERGCNLNMAGDPINDVI